MSFDPVELWHTMTPLAKGVAVLLIIMSVYSLTVAIERWIFFSKAKKQSLAFAKLVTLHLKQDKLQEAIDSSKKYKQSHLARVVSAGLYEFQHDVSSGSANIVGHDPIEAAERAIDFYIRPGTLLEKNVSVTACSASANNCWTKLRSTPSHGSIFGEIVMRSSPVA